MKMCDIVAEIERRTDFRREDVGRVVEMVFKIMLESMVRGDDVMIVRFGRFTLQRKAPHVCTDARTGKKTMSKYKAIIKFRPSRKIENQLCVLTNPELDWGDETLDDVFRD